MSVPTVGVVDATACIVVVAPVKLEVAVIVAVALVDALRAIVHKLFAVAKVHVDGEILIAGLRELKVTGSLATPELPTKLKYAIELSET